MSAEKITREMLYQRAVEISASIYSKAGFCIDDKNDCYSAAKNCEDCIKQWLINKAKKELTKTTKAILPVAKDSVNHPGHYETGRFECIDVMLETQGNEAVKGFCICNAFKYLYRHKRKNGVEDIKKAIWYLNKYIERESGDK